MNFNQLTFKVDNDGATPDGKLSAEEYNALLLRVQQLSEGATYGGIVKPASNPISIEPPVFYVAMSAGTYTNFGGLIVRDGEVAILQIVGNAWTKTTLINKGEFMAATPSGDPNHALYEAVGAVWNGDNDCWEYAEEFNITKQEMTIMWLDAYTLCGGTYLNGWFAQSPVRVNICTSKWSSAASMQRMFELAGSLEVAVLGQRGRTAIPNNIISAFYGCRKLKRVANVIDMQYCTTSTTYAFNLCSELRDITINNLKVDLDLSYCLLLTKKSLLNLIQKAAPTSAITITVHADVYAWASTDAEVQAALAAQPLITLISA